MQCVPKLDSMLERGQNDISIKPRRQVMHFELLSFKSRELDVLEHDDKDMKEKISIT
jgi:hypothetical protein